MLAVGLVCGCVTDTRRGQTQIAYSESDHPLSDTAVFSALAENVAVQGTITSVDGQPTSCWRAGCPGCIRVLPGSHVFTLKYNVFDNGLASYHAGETSVTVSDMRAQHVYTARFSKLETKFSIDVVDVGRKPYFIKDLGLRGVNLTCGTPIEF